MMTSSNGNIFRVTGPLCGEFTGHRWISRTKATGEELSLICAWINVWVNNRQAGDLRRHRAHYDVIVKIMKADVFILMADNFQHYPLWNVCGMTKYDVISWSTSHGTCTRLVLCCIRCLCLPILYRLSSLALNGARFNIKMSSYQYRKSHCGDKTVVRSSYLHSGISYTGKMTSWYWIRAQNSK